MGKGKGPISGRLKRPCGVDVARWRLEKMGFPGQFSAPRKEAACAEKGAAPEQWRAVARRRLEGLLRRQDSVRPDPRNFFPVQAADLKNVRRRPIEPGLSPFQMFPSSQRFPGFIKQFFIERLCEKNRM